MASRRAAEEMIAAGRVEVDGRTAVVGDKVGASVARITVDGVPLPVRPGLEYRLLYKPVGVISTASDERGRTTVVDLVPDAPRVFPVGRLDAASEGLILLTNDGDLANIVTHPRYGITKTYVVQVEPPVGKRSVRRLTSGIDLEDGPARALRAGVLETSGRRSLVELVMGDGRNREIRRMLASDGFTVVRLVRTAIGPVRDPDLPSGEWRDLAPAEVRSLYAASLPDGKMG